MWQTLKQNKNCEIWWTLTGGRRERKRWNKDAILKSLAQVQDFTIFYGKEQVKKKKIPPVDECCVFFFYSQWKPEGTGLPIFPSRGPGSWCSGELREGQDGQKAVRPPAGSTSGGGTGAGGHTVFSTQILWSFCQTGVYKAKTSRAFSYFLAYSPGVHLNRNQLLAFSLLQHVAGENLASGLAIIKNKNILLPWENSTTGKKWTEIFAFRIPELVSVQYLLSPNTAPRHPHPRLSFWNFPMHLSSASRSPLARNRETERNFSFHWEARIAGVVQILPGSFSVIKLNYQRKKKFFFLQLRKWKSKQDWGCMGIQTPAFLLLFSSFAFYFKHWARSLKEPYNMKNPERFY